MIGYCQVFRSASANLARHLFHIPLKSWEMTTVDSGGLAMSSPEELVAEGGGVVGSLVGGEPPFVPFDRLEVPFLVFFGASCAGSMAPKPLAGIFAEAGGTADPTSSGGVGIAKPAASGAFGIEGVETSGIASSGAPTRSALRLAACRAFSRLRRVLPGSGGTHALPSAAQRRHGSSDDRAGHWHRFLESQQGLDGSSAPGGIPGDHLDSPAGRAVRGASADFEEERGF